MPHRRASLPHIQLETCDAIKSNTSSFGSRQENAGSHAQQPRGFQCAPHARTPPPRPPWRPQPHVELQNPHNLQHHRSPVMTPAGFLYCLVQTRQVAQVSCFHHLYGSALWDCPYRRWRLPLKSGSPGHQGGTPPGFCHLVHVALLAPMQLQAEARCPQTWSQKNLRD